MDERISPLYITDNESGRKYELDFSRESVKWIESQGYRVEETFDFPNINIPKLFYYAFRKNHKSVSLNQATALLDKMGGLTEEIAIRLVDLYRQATLSNNVLQDKEDLAKNSKVTVEL